MPTCCLRGGCLTGPNHSGVALHGFLSYLIRCNLEGLLVLRDRRQGKQVRDNIHSFDVAALIDAFIQAPRAGEVYNIGGGKENSAPDSRRSRSRSDTVDGATTPTRKWPAWATTSATTATFAWMKAHDPFRSITKTLDDTVSEIVTSWRERHALKK